MDLVRFLGCVGSVHLHQPVALLHFDEATQLDDELMARLFVVDFEGLHRDLLANGGIETMSHHAACALAELPIIRDLRNLYFCSSEIHASNKGEFNST